MTFLYNNIPDKLVALDNWVCWRSIVRKNKATKVPFQSTGTPASSTNPDTWADFCSVCAATDDPVNRFDGIGFVLTEDGPFSGIDLDGCVDAQGTIAPEADVIIERIDSYAEFSPSGRGIRIIVRGKLQGRKGNKTTKVNGFKAVEVYDRKRFLTMTGRHIEGTPLTVEDRQEQLLALHTELFPAKTTGRVERRDSWSPHRAAGNGVGFSGSDDELIAKARAAANGTKFASLFDRGEIAAYGDDESAADMALCVLLVFWCGPDPARIERIFSTSALVRDKWTDRPDYRERTIGAAIEACGEHYRVGASSATTKASATPTEDPMILDPRDPMPSAREFMRAKYAHPEGCRLVFHRDEFYAWDSTRYVACSEGEVRSQLYHFLEPAMRLSRAGLLPFQPTRAKVENVADALRAQVILPASIDPPALIKGGTLACPLDQVLAASNGLVLLPTETLIPHTPKFFSTNVLAYGFEPGAPAPVQWLKFLDSIFPGDPQSIELLQEFMGYTLVLDTSQQKILLIKGPPRSGKGTIGRVWTSLLGAWNVAAPTLAGLETNFGLWPMIGKQLAIISDARLSGRTDQSKVVERLLSISGEDSITIDRKYKEPWTGRLGVRIVILTNESPMLGDASGAMSNRFVVLALRRSFLEREDRGLEKRLKEGLPGILLWALEGRKRLMQRGHFEQPDSALDVVRELNELTSPISLFIDERCEEGEAFRERVPTLFEAWRKWCQDQGREHTGDVQTFGRDLRAALPGVGENRPREGEARVRYYTGIRLRTSGPRRSADQPIDVESEVSP
jgi:putative DNA primase/helicase